MKQLLKNSWKLARKVSYPFQEFIQTEQSLGFILIFCTLLSLVLANSSIGENYIHFWHHEIPVQVGTFHLEKSLEFYINDGLMALFFLLVGVELKEEFLHGELSNPKSALLPFFLALGGMVFPALFYALFTYDTPYHGGWGVPMATDISLALGIFHLLGKRIPTALKVLLTALAVIDDLGGILVIAIFYTQNLDVLYLGISFLLIVVLLALNFFNVFQKWYYLIVGAVLWYTLLNSGVHATLAGVTTALCIPYNAQKNALEELADAIRIPISYCILPLFILVNTAIPISSNFDSTASYALGILAGLVFGKPIGITLVGYLSTLFKLTELPKGLQWSHIFGMGLVAGIGFTVALFIANLSFTGEVLTTAKLAIIIASLVAGILGVGVNLYLHRSKS